MSTLSARLVPMTPVGPRLIQPVAGRRALLEQVAQALMEPGPAGFAVEKWSAGETAFDQASGMFWGKLQAVCRGMLVAGMEESGELEGFTVRGEVTL